MNACSGNWRRRTCPGGWPRRQPAALGADVFAGIGDYVTKNPTPPRRSTRCTSSSSRRARQRVDARPEERRGLGETGEARLHPELTDADFMAMVAARPTR